MISPWNEDRHVWAKKSSSHWSKPRFSRSRKPLFIALCTVLLFLWWHHSASIPQEHNFHQRDPDPNLKAEKRTIPGKDQILVDLKKLKPPPLRVAPQSPLRVAPQQPQQPAQLLEREDEELKARAERPKQALWDQSSEHRGNDDGLHGLQFEHNQHMEEAAAEQDEDAAHSGRRHSRSRDALQQPQGLREAEKAAAPRMQYQGRRNDGDPDERTQPGGDDGQHSHRLDPNTQREGVIASPDQPEKPRVLEAEPDEHLSLEEKGESLPEIVHRPFEDAVRDTTLDGWEDEWIAHASFSPTTWGKLAEPKIDFVYLWVNGSEPAFQTTKQPYELNSVLNDDEGKWIASHGINRYRDWDELRYSLRSIEKNAATFRNRIQILVNSVEGTAAGKQIPTWLNDEPLTKATVQVLSQEEFFDAEKQVCLPTFNSLTIENQIFNTPSDTDHLFALSDDMLLGKRHAASDIYSPLFGPVMGFKANSYSAVTPPTEVDAHRFGEKPFLIYTSWLLNRRFGIRKRKGQGHFGHSLSRSVTREAIGSFPGPELQSACKRFRGEPGFQLYSWYVTFHYVIERHREALLWSYIMLRSDLDDDGSLSWDERQTIMAELEAGMKNEDNPSFRKRNFYHVAQLLERAGLEAPKVNTDILWTSLDGPSTIQGIDCLEFDVNECLAPGFSTSLSDEATKNPVFSTSLVFDRLARQNPKCGDCLLKLILNQVPRGLGPLLPHADTQAEKRETVVKAAMRYKYTVINPDALFVMVTDAEQIDSTLINRFIRGKKELAGQLCLNDDVATEDERELLDVQTVMTELYQNLFPEKSPYEK